MVPWCLRRMKLPPGAPRQERQERFDDELRQGGLDRERLGPGLRVFACRLVEAGVRLRAARASGGTPAAKASP